MYHDPLGIYILKILLSDFFFQIKDFFLSKLFGAKLWILAHLTCQTQKLKCKWNDFFIAEFEREAKIRKIVVYRFLKSVLVPEL